MKQYLAAPAAARTLPAALHDHGLRRHAERVRITRFARKGQALQSMFVTGRDTLAPTPTHHVFAMHIPFLDATSLPVRVDRKPVHRADAPVAAQRALQLPARSGAVFADEVAP